MYKFYDVSFWQDEDYTPVKINFAKMKLKTGFVIIRQGQELYTDEDFPDYWSDAKAAGMMRNVYHFFTWETNPADEADKFYNDLKSDPPTPFMFDGKIVSGYWGDFEWWSTVPSDALYRYWLFAKRMKELTGYWPGLYTGPGFWQQFGDPQMTDEMEADFAEMPIWVAQYSANQPEPFGPWKRVGKKICMWQYGTPAEGLEAGAESLDIDANYFMGTEEELFHFFKAGDEPGEEIKMQYSDCAKGLFVDPTSKTITASELSGYDFLIAKAVVGEDKLAGFTDAVQAAYDAGVPCVLFFENNNELYSSGLGYNEDRFPTVDVDKQIAAIRGQIYAGTAKRAVHAVMMDNSKTALVWEPGKSQTDVWIGKFGQWMLSMIWKAFKLPNYLYMNKNAVTAWPDSQQIVSLIEANGLSAPSWATTENGIPADGQKPSLSYWRSTEPAWHFWFYAYNLVDGALSVLYNGSKETLYQELNFTTSTDPEIPDEPDEPETPVTVDLTAVVTAIGELKAIAQAVLDKLNAIYK